MAGLGPHMGEGARQEEPCNSYHLRRGWYQVQAIRSVSFEKMFELQAVTTAERGPAVAAVRVAVAALACIPFVSCLTWRRLHRERPPHVISIFQYNWLGGTSACTRSSCSNLGLHRETRLVHRIPHPKTRAPREFKKRFLFARSAGTASSFLSWK